MHKRLLSLAVLSLLAVFALPGIASAHVLKVDGHIGAVFHINPDDNATTGHATDYTLAFSDDTGKFDLARCSCTISVVRNGQTITRQPLATSSGNNVSENHYTFPAPAVYTLRFTGVPRTPGAFQPFVLNYEVRVTGGQTATQPMPPLLWAGMGMAIGLILLGSYAANYTNDRMESKK